MEQDQPLRPKILTLPLQVAVMLVIIGGLFKVQHWPAANIILTVGFTGILLLYPVRYFNKQDKKPIDHVKLLLAITWALNGMFVIFHFPYQNIFKILSGISCLLWLVFEGIDYFEGSGHSNTTSAFASSLFAIAAVLIIGGAMLYVRHWPFSGIAISCGVLVGIIWIMKDLFRK